MLNCQMINTLKRTGWGVTSALCTVQSLEDEVAETWQMRNESTVIYYRQNEPPRHFVQIRLFATATFPL